MKADSQTLAKVFDGDRRAIARAISWAEAGTEHHRAALAEIHARAGRAHVIGLTGVPGAGKSTLVRAFAKRIRETGRSVGIVAIDPSSPFSGGAILGDRVRMADLSGDPGIFVRSMATRGALGGLAGATLEAVDVLDAAGFDVVLIETVGVGQDEVDIVSAAHTVLVVSAPGLGDGVQAIKAGVLEIADLHVVSKADRKDAGKTVADLRAMMALGTGRGGTWEPPVIATSAETGQGIAELFEAVESHRAHLETSGERAGRDRSIQEMRILKAAEDIVRRRFAKARGGHLQALVDGVTERRSDPHGAALRLLESLGE